MSAKSNKWKMPDWMEPYRDQIGTSGHSVEDLMNGHTAAQINLPLALIEMSCEGQIALLWALHRNDLLRERKPLTCRPAQGD